MALAMLAVPLPGAHAQPSSSGTNADAVALLGFKSGFSNGQALLPSWQSQSLEGLGLRGPIPRRGWVLPATLRTLQLGSNAINGTLPATWRLPAGLTELSLPDNAINGTVPSPWALPSGLALLDLDGNLLSGELPREWSMLPTSVVELGLAFNRLQGLLPEAVTLPGLQLMRLQNNSLTGPLPEWDVPQSAAVVVLPQDSLGFCGQVSARAVGRGGFPALNYTEVAEDIPVDGALLPDCPLPRPAVMDWPILDPGCAEYLNTTNETQSDIEFRYGHSWPNFARLNGGLSYNATLEPGQELCVAAATQEEPYQCSPSAVWPSALLTLPDPDTLRTQLQDYCPPPLALPPEDTFYQGVLCCNGNSSGPLTSALDNGFLASCTQLCVYNPSSRQFDPRVPLNASAPLYDDFPAWIWDEDNDCWVVDNPRAPACPLEGPVYQAALDNMFAAVAQTVLVDFFLEKGTAERFPPGLVQDLTDVQRMPRPAGDVILATLSDGAAADALVAAPPKAPARLLQATLEHNRAPECKLAGSLASPASTCMCDDANPYLHCHAQLVSDLGRRLPESVADTSLNDTDGIPIMPIAAKRRLLSSQDGIRRVPRALLQQQDQQEPPLGSGRPYNLQGISRALLAQQTALGGGQSYIPAASVAGATDIIFLQDLIAADDTGTLEGIFFPGGTDPAGDKCVEVLMAGVTLRFCYQPTLDPASLSVPPWDTLDAAVDAQNAQPTGTCGTPDLFAPGPDLFSPDLPSLTNNDTLGEYLSLLLDLSVTACVALPPPLGDLITTFAGDLGFVSEEEGQLCGLVGDVAYLEKLRTFTLSLQAGVPDPAGSATDSDALRLGVNLYLSWKILESPACQAALKSPTLANLIGCQEACRFPPEIEPFASRFWLAFGSKVFYTKNRQWVPVPGWNYAQEVPPCLAADEVDNPNCAPSPAQAGAPLPGTAPSRRPLPAPSTRQPLTSGAKPTALPTPLPLNSPPRTGSPLPAPKAPPSPSPRPSPSASPPPPLPSPPPPECTCPPIPADYYRAFANLTIYPAPFNQGPSAYPPPDPFIGFTPAPDIGIESASPSPSTVPSPTADASFSDASPSPIDAASPTDLNPGGGPLSP
ncbi:hypothetical protein N2152v2_000513 [Parachlorella kessleri]